MSDVMGEVSPGLRERKKLRTRAVIVDAAMDLCLKQGYEQTTVEQIAASADVSPRTFSRYFPTKDAVFLTLVDDYVAEVADELETVPLEYGPFEAIRQAHAAVLERIANRGFSRLIPERVVLMLCVLNASAALKQAAVEFRPDRIHVVVAQRLGVDVGDSRARLVSVINAATIVTACAYPNADRETARSGPAFMVGRINEAFAQLAAMSADVTLPADVEFESVPS